MEIHCDTLSFSIAYGEVLHRIDTSIVLDFPRSVMYSSLALVEIQGITLNQITCAPPFRNTLMGLIAKVSMLILELHRSRGMFMIYWLASRLDGTSMPCFRWHSAALGIKTRYSHRSQKCFVII